MPAIHHFHIILELLPRLLTRDKSRLNKESLEKDSLGEEFCGGELIQEASRKFY
jgi:hypothetical protein